MPQAMNKAGTSVNPRDGVVPIIKELDKGRLLIVGTGCYLTRYGLFLTARHVIEALTDQNREKLDVAFILHLAGNDQVHLRNIVRATLIQPPDLALGQADNYINKYPSKPLMNMRATLSTTVPEPGSRVITYAYPENEVLDFTGESKTPTVTSDYYEGEFLRHVTESEHPLMPYPYFETTIELRNGASGGPVFDSHGRVIGVNCRGWNFQGAEFEGQNLSYIVPVTGLLNALVDLRQLPAKSWEQIQIPEDRDGSAFTVAELAQFGHIAFDPMV